jgi:hypothetical protein
MVSLLRSLLLMISRLPKDVLVEIEAVALVGNSA